MNRRELLAGAAAAALAPAIPVAVTETLTFPAASQGWGTVTDAFVLGHIWVDMETGKLLVWNGAAWIYPDTGEEAAKPLTVWDEYTGEVISVR